LGFLLGDGYVTEKLVRIGLASIDTDHVHSFREAVGSEHAVTETEDAATVGFKNEHMATVLDKHGVGPDKTFNDDVPTVPEQYKPDFYRGWFDADGSFRGGRIQLTSANVNRLKKAASRLPFDTNVRDIPDTNYANLYVYGDSRKSAVKWLYPDGESTEPKLTRKWSDCQIWQDEQVEQ
jgi:hypothetical protein